MPVKETAEKRKKCELTLSLYPEEKERYLALARERGVLPGVYLSELLAGREPSALPPDSFLQSLLALQEVCWSLSGLAAAAEAGIIPPDGRYEQDLKTVQRCIGDLVREGYGP